MQAVADGARWGPGRCAACLWGVRADLRDELGVLPSPEHEEVARAIRALDAAPEHPVDTPAPSPVASPRQALANQPAAERGRLQVFLADKLVDEHRYQRD